MNIISFASRIMNAGRDSYWIIHVIELNLHQK